MVDQAQIDKDGNGILFNGSAKVERIENVAGQRDVFLLQAVYEFERPSQICPRPGQFYMIRTKTSNGYFKRPISVYHSEEFADAASGKRMLRLQFLILQLLHILNSTFYHCHYYLILVSYVILV